MLITSSNLDQAFTDISSSEAFSLDTETTGLSPYKGDKAFLATIATDNNVYSFTDISLLDILSHLEPKTIVFANSKFDVSFLEKEGINLMHHTWFDVLVADKCIYNQHMRYDLKSVAARYGFEKSSEVEKYIADHKLYTIEEQPGKKSRTRKPAFDQVPFDIMQKYAENDAAITLAIYKKQREKIEEIEKDCIKREHPSFKAMLDKEFKVTKVLYKMERHGIKIDEEFINRAIAHEQARVIQATKQYEKISGAPLVDSNTSNGRAFAGIGHTHQLTEKGNISFGDAALSNIKHPLADALREYRDATKRLNSYYRNFLYYADSDGVVHCNFKQAHADTFRFSITNPALQTLNSEDEGEFLVRNSFKARDGFNLVAIDYAQQEYRLTADLSGETTLIKKIMEGEDVHTATANLMGVDRQKAKTLNFALLYGAGAKKLAIMLKTTEPEAHRLKKLYFSSLKKISSFVKNVKDRAEARGFIFNYAGRRLYFPEFMKDGKETSFSYASCNHLIQGAGSEIMRTALIGIDEFLSTYKSSLLLSIHDECLIEVHEDEMHLIPQIRKIMEDSYTPINGCYMGTGVEYGKSWGALKELQSG